MVSRHAPVATDSDQLCKHLPSAYTLPVFEPHRQRDPKVPAGLFTTLMMGACMSSNKEDEEQKKRSQAIDRALDEDSKKLRRECKILLLGGFSLP